MKSVSVISGTSAIDPIPSSVGRPRTISEGNMYELIRFLKKGYTGIFSLCKDGYSTLGFLCRNGA